MDSQSLLLQFGLMIDYNLTKDTMDKEEEEHYAGYLEEKPQASKGWSIGWGDRLESIDFEIAMLKNMVESGHSEFLTQQWVAKTIPHLRFIRKNMPMFLHMGSNLQRISNHILISCKFHHPKFSELAEEVKKLLSLIKRINPQPPVGAKGNPPPACRIALGALSQASQVNQQPCVLWSPFLTKQRGPWLLDNYDIKFKDSIININRHQEDLHSLISYHLNKPVDKKGVVILFDVKEEGEAWRPVGYPVTTQMKQEISNMIGTLAFHELAFHEQSLTGPTRIPQPPNGRQAMNYMVQAGNAEQTAYTEETSHTQPEDNIRVDFPYVLDEETVLAIESLGVEIILSSSVRRVARVVVTPIGMLGPSVLNSGRPLAT